MDEIILEIKLDEVNVILTALSEMPYKYSVGIIEKLHAQTRTQVTAPV